ncbi:MAG TPA: hypothetical protein VGF56_14600 [Rhizomicrobium sp.]|jgi:hypothetical protein
MTRDDRITIAAIAILAMCVATVAHEAVGHGTACLLLGGRITQLTSVYFDCSRHNIWLPAAGPLGDLAAAALSWLLLRFVPLGNPKRRLFLAATMAFSLFWAAGYLLYSAVTGEGDNAIVARLLFGAPDWPWRIGLFVLGAALYRIGISATASALRPFAQSRGRLRAVLLTTFLSGSIFAVIAAALYAPDRIASAIQGALEIGAGSLPLAVLAFRMPANADPHEAWIVANPFWIAGAAILFTAFASSLGRGLP